MNAETKPPDEARPLGKFENPDVTAKGETRAVVPFVGLDTLWLNAGTLCNITCASCYIESSPRNDRLEYLTAPEARAYLDEIATLGEPTREIGITGGEPFLNPSILEIMGDALDRGFEVLVLTNAMVPMQRRSIKEGLLALKAHHADRLTLRVSLDHHTEALHDKERGAGSWKGALAGIDWLCANGFRVAIAGRTCWDEPEDAARAGYAALIAARGWPVDAADRASLVLFPEMDETRDVPEITTACWGILKKRPVDIMCARSRMVVKRKGAAKPTVLPCTLIAYDPRFEMGSTLAEARAADEGMFTKGGVKLCHTHCARFCVLGGGSCS